MPARWLLLGLAGLLGGCAVSYKDADGVQNHLGLLWVKQRADQGSEIVQVTRVGLSAEVGDQTGMLLGYKQQVQVIARDPDAQYRVDFDTRDPLGALLTVEAVNNPAD